jgi:hypothetical protein
MKAITVSANRHLSLVGQATSQLQQLPQAENLLAMQRRINHRVLHDLFEAHAQIQIARTSTLTSSTLACSGLVITLSAGKREIEAAELVRELQHWYPQEVRPIQATQFEIMKSSSSSIQIEIGNADPRLFLARLLHCANKLDPCGESQLVRDFPQADFVDFLYYQASRQIHDDFLEQLPGFESLMTAG